MGRPPKNAPHQRSDGSYPLSSLSKDPIVREFMNEYWSKDNNVDSKSLLPIPRDKTKVEYVDAPPLVSEEDKENYRNSEVEKLKISQDEEEKSILRSKIEELHTLKRTHLEQLEECKDRQDMYEKTIRHLLDTIKHQEKIPSIYTKDPPIEKPRQLYNPINNGALGARQKRERGQVELPGTAPAPKRVSVYDAIRESMLGRK